MKEPLASFATVPYFSPHAFGLRRRRRQPDLGPLAVRARGGRAADPRRRGARRCGRDYLHEELAERLRAGSVAFELQFQLAADDDPLDDPTAVWPDERELIAAGRLELTEIADDPERDGHIDVFDPTRIVDGIELSDDPILHARPKAYSVSAYKRWDRAEP